MQSDGPSILVEHEHERAIVSFVAPVTESSVIHLVRTINELHRQRFYRHVELQIASPGGQVLALQYFLEALAYWKDRGLSLTTLALTSCSSAAAVMLSLGDRRRASPASLILYHFARIHVSESTPITRTHARHFAESLELLDTRILRALVSRAASNTAPPHELSAEDRNALQELRVALGDTTEAKDSVSWLEQWLEATREASAQDREARWTTLYRILCETDRPISGRLAQSLGLVDELVRPMAGESAAPPLPRRSLRVPEWKRAYRDGAVDTAYLKRHTLVLGETGSGKTASAILPVLAAAYRAPEVGVALVIDPKHELGSALRRLETDADSGGGAPKRLRFIDARRVKIDLMSTQAWNIDGLLGERRYWSAAERILQRVAGLSAMSEARVLLGHPPRGRDPYWEREGVRLATAVIAMAIEWIVDAHGFARLIRRRLSDEPQGPWAGIRECFERIHPGALALESKVEEWLERVRADYRRRFARPVDEDLEPPDAENEEDDLRYAPDWSGERGRYEKDRWEELSRLATSRAERAAVDASKSEYDERMQGDREALAGVREAMMELVGERLADGVAGRDEAAWRSLLGEALDKEVEEIREEAKRRKARAPESVAESIEYSAGQDIETALERLIVDALRDAGGEEWKTLSDDARRGRREALSGWAWAEGNPVRSTVFLQVLDGLEQRCLTVGETQYETANAMAVASVVLQGLLSEGTPESAQALAREWSARGGEFAKTGATLGEFTRTRTEASPQYEGVMGHAASVIEEFARPSVERVVYFGCERAVREARKGSRTESGEDGAEDAAPGSFLDFRECVSRREGTGTVYVYQPSRHRHDELIAKACKSLFFEAVLDNEARRAPDSALPLAGYIADEFQRFVTADAVHGEQSFLDVCRAFGAFAVLACQSVASLRYALCDLEGDPDKRNSAIDIICNNTATKLFFRSTDEETVRRVRTVSPLVSGGHSVIDIRPLSTLEAGECYASFPDGRFERVQIEEYGAGG